MSAESRTRAETANSRGYTLVDVLAPDNLALAWKRVKAIRCAAGIDGLEVGDFPAFMRQHWEKLRGKLEGAPTSRLRCAACPAVDCDLKAFFDTVDHQKLMARLRGRVADPALLALILRYLKAGAITREGRYEEQLGGVPQGGPLSPLLANILLDELDLELEERGHKFVRYADDFIILCRSQRAGQRILRSVRRFLSDRLKLIVNEAKSRVVKLAEASFLGFGIVRRRVRWTAKSLGRFKAQVRQITRRTRGHSPKSVIAELATYVRGAFNYYGPGVAFGEARELDRWFRRRARLYYWKQWGRPRTRRRKLLKLGVGRDEGKRLTEPLWRRRA